MTIESDMDSSCRRLLQSSGAALGAAWLSLQWPTILAAAQHAQQMATAPEKRLLFLSPEEARDLEAIAAQVVARAPAAGTSRAGILYFIDHVHASLRQDAGLEFRSGLERFSSELARRRPGAGRFADLAASDQAEYLRSQSSSPFVENLRALALLGLFSLPASAGERERGGWSVAGLAGGRA